MNEKVMNSKTRKALWRDACNEYLEVFCTKHEYNYEPDMWIANDPGTIAMIGDMFVSMDNIRYDVDNDVPEEYFDKWYWKNLDLHELGVEHWMNYESYCKGAPDIWTDEQMDKIRQARAKVEETKADLKKLVDEYQNKLKDF